MAPVYTWYSSYYINKNNDFFGLFLQFLAVAIVAIQNKPIDSVLAIVVCDIHARPPNITIS
jgi:hypothetical protein